MSEESNRQFVLDFLNTLYSGDIETTLARCTDDIEFIANAPVDLLPHLGHRRGKDEMREMWDAILARYSELRCEVSMSVAEGDKVAVYIRVFFRKSINQRMMQFDIGRLVHAARRQGLPDQGNYRHLRSGAATGRTRRHRDPDRAKAKSLITSFQIITPGDCSSSVHAGCSAQFARTVEPRRLCRDPSPGCFPDTTSESSARGRCCPARRWAEARRNRVGPSRMEPFKAPHFEGPSGVPAFAAGAAIGAIGGSAASKSVTPKSRSQPKPRVTPDRQVI